MAESSSFNNVTRQIARVDILNNQQRESFKSYMTRVAIRLVFPGHVLFFRVKNTVQADFLDLAKCLGFWTNDRFSLFLINSMLGCLNFYMWRQQVLCLVSIFCLQLLLNYAIIDSNAVWYYDNFWLPAFRHQFSILPPFITVLLFY